MISGANRSSGGGKPRLKRKAPHGRGIKDAKTIMDTVMENWDDLIEELEKLEPADQDKIKDYFNNLIKNETDLGDILFGEMPEFKSRIEFLQEEDFETYANEIEK